MVGTDISKAFNNNGLFSNHYLENMIQKVPEWNDDTRLSEVYLRIKEILDRKGKNFERYVEADLEHNWVRPVLDILGHHYGVQEGLHHDPLKPDYAFFPDQQTLEDAYSHKKDAEDFYKKAIAVGDAKSWNVLLDKSRQGKARRDMTNPSFQIDVYLRATPPKWAILTNGKLWRLYHEDTSVKMDCYYEVNLPEMINNIEETKDLTYFKYFYLFFRLEAFPQVPLGSSFLDRVREESIIYAQKIGKDLQENVYKAMKVLAEGFFAEQSNALSHFEEDIRNVQENSLRLLYRLLFIFFAESRKLLNTDNKYYREMSLRKLKEEIAAKIDQEETLLAVRSTYWEGLKDLFKLINDGSEAFGYPKEEFYIPAYNGGLFDPTKNPFLAQKKIGNSYLAKAIDLLSRSKGKEGMAFVDYSSLQVQHLGSIYEGILEYKLHLAEEPMVAIKEKGREVWLPKREVTDKKILDSIEAGSLYLITDKGERKATGSFYTPEYIVEYIVKNTLAPLIDPLIEEAIWSEELRKDLLKKLLSLKVLDPAMGSGHFLVEATDYIAREIIHAKEIARREDLESEEVAENDIHWARREVVRNCIYGVDLNPMAVELAKLSLWLTTVASSKPLSFLDHHLRCGNSLIGADLDKLSALPGSMSEQPPLWKFVLKSHTDKLLSKYSLMSSLPDDKLQMVKWKEGQFREIQDSELSSRLRELADVWLSTFFGNEVNDDDYYELQNHISPEKFPDWGGLRENEWYRRAQELAKEKRFFHWELEFPEAFQGENRGFDAVIGNPPYSSKLSIETKQIMPLFKLISYRCDPFGFFLEQSFMLSKNKGFIGFIIPATWTGNAYYSSLRRDIIQSNSLKSVIVFDGLVFSEANIDTSIIICHKQGVLERKFSMAISTPEQMDKMVQVEKPYEIVELSNRRDITRSVSGDWDKLFADMDKTSRKLSEITSSISLGLRLASIKEYTSEIQNSNYPTPLFLGDNIERYGQLSPKLFFNPEVAQIVGGTKNPIVHKSKKILIQSIRNLSLKRRLVPALDEIGCYFGGNVVGIILNTNSLSIYFLLALLASNLLNEFFSHRFTTISLTSTFLGEIPIRCINFTTATSERTCRGAELQTLYEARKFEEILALVESCLPKDVAGKFIPDQEKSDVIHDVLSFLAEQMLEMNKQKQKETKGFLSWIEGELEAKVDDLTSKTKIQAYYDLGFREFHTILKKNKKKLGIDPSRREPAERLAAEFQGSIDKLKPLMEKIKLTDELIDQIVYRLYGLTEEEIKIVEGSAKA